MGSLSLKGKPVYTMGILKLKDETLLEDQGTY